jgi:hypothetical protein
MNANFKKLTALGITTVMGFSMAACGSSTNTNSTGNDSSTSSATVTPVANATVSDDVYSTLVRDGIPEGAITFEDGNTAFAIVNEGDRAHDSDYEMKLETVAGQNVLMVTRPNGGTSPLGIDISSLLGDNLTKCASFSIDVGVLEEGTFASAGGTITTYTGEDNESFDTSWTVYLDTDRAKTINVDLGDTSFVEGANNIIVINLTNDTATENYASMFVDNLICYDADGNVLPLDSSVEMAAPSGFGEVDWSNMVKEPTNEVSLGLSGTSGTGWWPVSNFTGTVYDDYATSNGVTKIDSSLFVPGSVVTIYYTEGAGTEWQRPFLWMGLQDSMEDGAIWASVRLYVVETKNEKGDLVDDPSNYINQTHTICQFTYEQIDEAVYNYLYDQSYAGTDYNASLTEDQRADYYANWPQYLIMFGIGDMGLQYTVADVTVGTAAE